MSTDPLARLRREINRACEDIPPNRETHRLLMRAHAMLAEMDRMAAEIVALRARLGDAPPGTEPAGCPTPGACSCAAASR
jgi:hypothetical protein